MRVVAEEIVDEVLIKYIHFEREMDRVDTVNYVLRSWMNSGVVEDMLICGPHGSGKSVLAKLLSVWLHPSVFVFDNFPAWEEIEGMENRAKVIVAPSQEVVPAYVWQHIGYFSVELKPAPEKITFLTNFVDGQMLIMRRYWCL